MPYCPWCFDEHLWTPLTFSADGKRVQCLAGHDRTVEEMKFAIYDVEPSSAALEPTQEKK